MRVIKNEVYKDPDIGGRLRAEWISSFPFFPLVPIFTSFYTFPLHDLIASRITTL
jgi:hypothetical protein